MINEVTIMVRHPLGNERAVLGIRTAYATQAGGFTTNLVMLDDGVFCLTGKLPAYVGELLRMYLDSEGRLACWGPSLASRGISRDDLLFPEVEILEGDDLAQMAEDSDSINMF